MKNAFRLMLAGAWAAWGGLAAAEPEIDASKYVADDGMDHYYSGAPDVAMQLSNPVAALISVPFQFNFDSNIGPSGWAMIGT